MNAVEISRYCVAYRGSDDEQVPVLHDLELQIGSGELVLVTGPSGCGKTTLLRCINGLVPGFIDAEVDGELRVAGRSVADQEPRDLAAQVGMVFQDPRSEFFTYDVTSELAFTCENFGIDGAEIARRIEQVAAQVGITDLLGRRMAQLSSGEKQKVAVAAALMLYPGVLLFDEPSANLDTEGLQMLTRTMASLKARGVTIVVADHRLSYLAEVLDRCIVLDDGRIVHDLEADELATLPDEWFDRQGLRRYRLREPAGGRTWGAASPGDTDTATEPTQVSQQASVVPAANDGDSGTGPRLLDVSFAHPHRRLLWTAPDLRLPTSGIIGITGANGCGKTTLLKLIMGVHRRHRGRILRGGRTWRPAHRSRDCAWVMQDVDYQLLGESVRAELLVGIAPGPEAEQRADQLLDRIGLSQLGERHPLTLSGGQKQRLGIALACMKKAPVVCLDEPTSGLDARNMRKVAALLTELAAQGVLVLVITHDQEFAELTFDQTIRIADGLVSLDAASTAACDLSQALGQGARHVDPNHI